MCKLLGIVTKHKSPSRVTLVPVRFNSPGGAPPRMYSFQPNALKSSTCVNLNSGLCDKFNVLTVDGNLTPSNERMLLRDKSRWFNPSGNATPFKVVIWLRDKLIDSAFDGKRKPFNVSDVMFLFKE